MKLTSQTYRLYLFLPLIALLSSFYVTSLEAAVVRVAVASNFMKTFKVLADDFESKTQHSVQASYASSGKLYHQIVNGAPFDVFLSADQDKPQQLVKKGIGIEASVFCYAQGQLVLWSAESSFSQGLEDLKIGKFKKIAVANPKLAPYGLAAVEVLTGLGIFESAKEKIVRGENIGQTLQFANSGNVDLAFLALAQVVHLNAGSHWLVPSEAYSPIKQEAVLLSAAEGKIAAKDFTAYLKSQNARDIITEHGYR